MIAAHGHINTRTGTLPGVYGTAGWRLFIIDTSVGRVYGESIDTVGAITEQAEKAAHQIGSIFHFVVQREIFISSNHSLFGMYRQSAHSKGRLIKDGWL